ncbi:hypothetical protein LCGC14_1592740 [marine sediment metagenome]|uniref:Uncharacterized protein n=1 Tax=marine sediment metagenome TaxID=412755 RepID=A0A0F9IDF7_9ZZZZ
MAEWYETDDRTEEQARRAQQVYYTQLLGSAEAREFLCDLKRRVKDQIEGSALHSELAVAQIWLGAFVEVSLTIAGVVDEMEICKALAPIAESYEVGQKETNIPEDHLE